MYSIITVVFTILSRIRPFVTRLTWYARDDMATASVPSVPLGTLSKVSVLREGPLFKRQRGQNHADLKKLKFQQRYISLTQDRLEYHRIDPGQRVNTRDLAGRLENAE